MKRLAPVATGVTLLALCAVVTPARAAASTVSCVVGGPTGTYRVLRLDVPQGSDVLNVELRGGRTVRPAGDSSSWHLAQGIFVLDSSNHLVADRVSNQGSNPRRTVVGTGGTPATVSTPGPDTPFVHTQLDKVAGLAPGSYTVVAFGSDGDDAAPNDQWGGEVQVAAGASCHIEGTGELLDVNHTDFRGGTQASTAAAGIVEGATLQRTIDHNLVVGFMDVATQVAGDASLDYQLGGSGSGVITDAIVPFAGLRGQYSFTAHVQGVAPLVSIVALGVDQ